MKIRSIRNALAAASIAALMAGGAQAIAQVTLTAQQQTDLAASIQTAIETAATTANAAGASDNETQTQIELAIQQAVLQYQTAVLGGETVSPTQLSAATTAAINNAPPAISNSSVVAAAASAATTSLNTSNAVADNAAAQSGSTPSATYSNSTNDTNTNTANVPNPVVSQMSPIAALFVMNTGFTVGAITFQTNIANITNIIAQPFSEAIKVGPYST